MIKDLKNISIGEVWNGGSGATIKSEILAKPEFGPDIKLLEPLQADLFLVRLKEGVSAVLTDFTTSVGQTCSKCLDEFTQKIEVDTFERHFFATVPDHDYDPLEVFLIAMKDMSIDLTEAFRQEIILHFPMIPVCSERCQGLCPSCAVNLNHQKHRSDCDYQQEQAQQTDHQAHRPLSQLKDLFKQ